MSRLTRRAMVEQGDEPLELVVLSGSRVDVGLDWSRALRMELIHASAWVIPDAVSTDGNDRNNLQTWLWLTNLLPGACITLRNDISTLAGLALSRCLTVRVQ